MGEQEGVGGQGGALHQGEGDPRDQQDCENYTSQKVKIILRKFIQQFN